MISFEGNNEASSENGVAIVGMACIFPGAPDLKAFWENIVNKVDAISDPPEDWGGEFSYDPHSTANNRIYCKRGGYLGDLARFDPLEFGIMPKAVDGSEPEHFLALRVAYEALKDAGFPDIPINRERTEVILGRGTYVNRALMNLHQHGFILHQTLNLLRVLHPEYPDGMIEELERRLKAKLPPFDGMTAPGVVSSIMSGRIANRLDLKGVNYCVDAACASSLVAVEHGIQDLRSGKCDAVIAGGVQLSANNLVLMVFSQLGALSRRAEIHPFDKDADGTLLGEGVGTVVLKRREDAERDGNRIYALIKAVGSSSDGRATSVVAPTVEGEEHAVRRAYESAGIPPSTVGLIEAHGTAMPLGDLTEIQALSRVFGSRDWPPRCAMGSVKSMIGHLIPAAGIAGLIKAALALYHKILPPTLHCEQPRPRLEIEKTPFYINTETRPWIHGVPDTPRRAGVNAFGFGGVNAHAILEQYGDEVTAESDNCNWDTEMCVFAGQSRQDLIERCEKIQTFLSSPPDIALKDLAYTVNSTMEHGPCRLAIVAHSVEEVSRKLAYALERLQDPACARIQDRSGIYFFQEPLAKQGKLAFLFPGEGSQYIGMLADLCIHFPEVRYCFDLTDRAFIREGGNDVLSDFLFPPPTCLSNAERKGQEERLWQMEVGVKAVTTANRALFKALTRLEILPAAVLGHSSGEFSALEAARAIGLDTEEDLIHYVLEGKKSVSRVAAAAEALPEAMLVAVGAEDRSVVSRIVERIQGSLHISMDNCPHQVIICGSEPFAKKAIEELNAAGVSSIVLPFRRAYHTPTFESACGPLRDFFGKLKIERPKIPIYSCASAALFPNTPQAIRELLVAQWTLPVRFRETIESMYESNFRMFIEVGPRGNLTGFVNDILRGKSYMAVPVNVHYRSGIAQFQHALGLLAAHGVRMKPDYLYSRRSPQLLGLDAPAGAYGSGTKLKKAPKLSLALPMLSLNREDLREVSLHSAQTNAESCQNLNQEMAAGEVPRTKATTTSLFEQQHGQSEQLPATEAPLTDKVCSGALPTQEEVVIQHFRTMEGFLESQKQVMKAYMDRKQAYNLHPTLSDAQQATEGIRVRQSANYTPPMGRRPFIGTITHEIPGREIAVRRDLSLDEDLFLKHHTLGGKVSMIDENLLALPVMPFTMSMEMLAEAAQLLLPGKLLVGMKDIRANRWIVIESRRLGLEMVAKRRSENEIHVLIREDAFGEIALGLPIIEGTVVFADVYPELPKVGEFPLRGEKPSRFTEGNLYTTGMFSGPSFQAIVSIDRWGEDGSVATFEALPAERLFRSVPDPKFAIDPILLDTAGQQAAHWNAEESSMGFNFFPYRVGELRLYRPNLTPRQRVESRLRIKPLSETQFRSNIDLIGSDGRVFAQLIGWEDRSFDLPETFYGIRHGSPEIVLTSAWNAPILMLPRQDSYECRRVEGFSEELLTGHGKIWLKVLAHQVLSSPEREVWRNLNLSDKRQMEWLLGRSAAKDAVRILLKRQHGIELCPADIEIQTDKYGRPLVSGPWRRRMDYVPRVSITHKRGIAVALAVDGCEGFDIGIDLEKVRLLKDGFTEFVFHPDERQLISTINIDQTDEWILRFWCAKEALSKALGIGLNVKPKDFRVRDLDLDNGTVGIEIQGKIIQKNPELNGVRFGVHTIVEHDLIAGIALYPRRLRNGYK